MDARGVRLHAVVHEILGAEEFKPFIKGNVYLDPEVKLCFNLSKDKSNNSI